MLRKSYPRSRPKRSRAKRNQLQSHRLTKTINLQVKGFETMKMKWKLWFASTIACFSVTISAWAQTPPQIKVDSDTISGLGARNIGSATMSGRIAALDAVQEGQRLTVYIGAASGGVWKSVNGGTTFKPVFDKQPVQSIGAIAIDPKNPKIIWAGTGEAWTR